MKQYILILLAIGTFLQSCDKDDDDHDHMGDSFNYHAHINAPNSDDKHVGDTLQIQINFEEHGGQTIHHVKVRIYNEATDAEVYNKPDEAHVHEESGIFLFEDTFVLTNDNGVEAHSDWILEAKVWGHDEGMDEEISTIRFHVHP